MKVITNTAITTVPNSDCNEPVTPVPTTHGVPGTPEERSLEGRMSAEGLSVRGSLGTSSLEMSWSGEFIYTAYSLAYLSADRDSRTSLDPVDCGREAR